jgi:1,4-alpha-glucan branching enzyme
MHDTLSYLSREPVYRRWHHDQMTFATVYAWSENFILPISHDEVVHGKRALAAKVPGDAWQRLATVRALLAFMWAHPGKQLLFMGNELGDEREWSEQRGLDWSLTEDPLRAGLARLVGDLNAAYRSNPALWTQDTSPQGFAWIVADDKDNNVFAFARTGSDSSTVVCAVNFSAVPRESYRLALPAAGGWTEILNTDSSYYGGSGVGNLGEVRADGGAGSGQPASATLRLPPLGALWLRPARPT